jgi:hypothetical protein
MIAVIQEVTTVAVVAVVQTAVAAAEHTASIKIT